MKRFAKIKGVTIYNCTVTALAKRKFQRHDKKYKRAEHILQTANNDNMTRIMKNRSSNREYEGVSEKMRTSC